ncbi:MAG: hypothetical protein LBG24_00245 [Treponema sp.]|jgi:hypothetical protein|nr:hypothetical protein [Treponema sp.]
MSFGKSLLVASLLSLGLGAFMFFLVLGLMPLESNCGYAVLTVDASYSDRLIGELLASEAFTQGFLSESNQWVFLDDFGTLQRIPLDAYRDRVEPFDPRDDGYAEKLRAFFVREGKRLFFIPFSGDPRLSDPWFNKPRIKAFEASLAAVFTEIPFALTFLGSEKPFLFYFLLFAAAAGATMVLSGEPVLILALLPILGSLAFAGPPGFALCAVLVVLTGIAAEPLRKRWAARRYGQDGIEGREPAKNLGKGYPVLAVFLTGALLFLWLCGILYGMSVTAGNMVRTSGKSLVQVGVAVLVCSGIMLWVILWLEANQGKAQNHVRFMPVRIMDAATWGPINRTILPFALVALVALYGPWLYEGLHAYHDPGFIADSRYLIDTGVYENHARYQASFSLIPLGSGKDLDHPQRGDPPGSTYRQYRLGADGLIAGMGGYEQVLSPDDDPVIPPFPLEDLIAFLEGFRHTGGGQPSRMKMLTVTSLNMIGFLVLLMASGVYSTVLSWFKQTGKKRNSMVYNEKRIAA